MVSFIQIKVWLLCYTQKLSLGLPHLLPSATAKPPRVRIEIRYHGLVLLMSFFHIILEFFIYKGHPAPDVKHENQLRFMARRVVISTAVIHAF